MLAENDAPRAHEQALRLQTSLPIDAAFADRARVLNLLSRTEIYLALTEPAAQHAQLALDLATQHGDRVGQAEAHLNVALNSVNQGDIKALVSAATRSLAVLDGLDRPDLLGEALLRTAMMYRRLGQIEESVAMCVQAMAIARRTKNPLALAYAHQGLGISYDQSARQGEAREHYLQMRDNARIAHSKLLEAYALAGLGGVTGQLGDYRGAESLTQESVQLFRAAGTPFNVNFGLFALAVNLRSQGRYAQTLPILDEVVATYERYPNRIGLWYTLNARSANQQSLADLASARADADRAYALAKDIGFPPYMSESAQRVAAVAAASGDHKRAFELAVEANDMTAKAVRERASVRMVELTQRYESESRQREIAELTQRNQQQTAEIRQRELQQRWLGTVLGGSVLALAGTSFFLIRLRQSHRALEAANTQLKRSEEEIRALNTGLEQRVHARTLELRQQARYLRTLIDMLPMWAWFKDTQSHYLVTNQAHALARGRTVDDMVGKSDLELWPGDLAASSRADDAEVMASRERKTVEVPLVDGGETVWMETYKAAVIDDDGSVLGTVGVARNISERKAAESAREAALIEAKQLARLRSEFLAQMSHELRTPLNGILGFAQLLQADKQLTDRQLRGLSIIEQSGQHLLALIDDLLDLARIDAGKLELHPTQVNLSAFLLVVSDIIRVKADEKNLLFSCEATAELPTAVRVDEMRLRQVLLNLLSNAVKFTDAGQVLLRVQATELKEAALVADPRDAMVRLRFEVEDSGIGMTDAQLATIFQRFEQVADVKRRKGGAGLGLAISQQLVLLMGSQIQVRSQAGRGTVFWFEVDVPASQNLPAVPPAQGHAIAYEGPRKKVLVVDDAPHVRALLTETLTGLGFEVAQAENGQLGIDQASTFMPDLIFMDITMPVMGGLEAMRQLRLMPGLAHVPIIANSASVTEDVEASSRAAGASGFIPKPIEHHALLAAMERHLDVRWVYDAASA